MAVTGGSAVSNEGAETSERRERAKAVKFSLMFFSADGSSLDSSKYRLLLDCAKFADENGFHAVWTPERHFKAFGGLYPSPSVLSAALAMHTNKLDLRAGSVVLPLQDPLRVTEEWSVVDNLSEGRVGVAFASGWNPDDFVLAPDSYSKRHEIMYDRIQKVRRLWRGGVNKAPNGVGEEAQVQVLPRPVQRELPIWVTAMSSPETFRKAGEIGANILTALIDQDIRQCKENIRIYRQSLLEHGYEESQGQVTLMLHTYIGADLHEVKERVRGPFSSYLRTFLSTKIRDIKAFCKAELGVDELACLLDFGMVMPSIMEGLTHLVLLKDRYDVSSNVGTVSLHQSRPRWGRKQIGGCSLNIEFQYLLAALQRNDSAHG